MPGRKEDFMKTLALSALVAIFALPGSRQPPLPKPPQEWKATTQNLDGHWAIVYVEIEGKKLSNTGFTDVRIKDHVLSCKHDGKDRSWRLEFGPAHVLKVSELFVVKSGQAGKDKDSKVGILATYVGCYIASQDYLCIALNIKGTEEQKIPKDIGLQPTLLEQPGQKPIVQPPGPAVPGGVPYNAGLVLILRRENSSADKGR
jgi:hypothetical protein